MWAQTRLRSKPQPPGTATVSPQGLKVLARAPILEHLAWTPPTLVGRTLYVRDRQTIAAYDLS